MDKSKSDRPEWIILKYDSTYHPKYTFHIELNWVVASGGVVDDFLNNIVTRKSKMFGVNLVQIPIDWGSPPPPNSTNTFTGLNPFTSPFHIKFAAEYQQLLSDENIIQTLVKLFDFIVESPGYIHKSVSCFLSITSDGFLL
jgi:hypothetical protein